MEMDHHQNDFALRLPDGGRVYRRLGAKQKLSMGVSKKCPIRALALLSAILFCLAGIDARAEKKYYLEVDPDPELSMSTPGQFGFLIPFDENREIHKSYDGEWTFPAEFDGEGAPVRDMTVGTGLVLDMTDFSRDGDTVSFNIVVENRQMIGWERKNGWYFPVFQDLGFWSTLDSGPFSARFGEWFELCQEGSTGPKIPMMPIVRDECDCE